MKLLSALFLLLQTSLALSGTCVLPAMTGKLVNKTKHTTEDLVINLEAYSPKDGPVTTIRVPENFQGKMTIAIEKDGTFHLPEMTFKNVPGLYLFPDFYNQKLQRPLNALGVSKSDLWHELLSSVIFRCDRSSQYLKEYKSFFSSLELNDLGNIKFTAKTPDGVEFQDYMNELFKNQRPEYLNDDYSYALEVYAYLSIKGKGTDRSELKGYVNNEGFSHQGLKLCTSYDTCLAHSSDLESMKKSEFPLYITNVDFNDVTVTPLNQLSGKLSYELMVDIKINVFKKGVSYIYEVINFRKKGTERTVNVTGSLEEVNKEYSIIFSDPTFCKIKEPSCS